MGDLWTSMWARHKKNFNIKAEQNHVGDFNAKKQHMILPSKCRRLSSSGRVSTAFSACWSRRGSWPRRSRQPWSGRAPGFPPSSAQFVPVSADPRTEWTRVGPTLAECTSPPVARMSEKKRKINIECLFYFRMVMDAWFGLMVQLINVRWTWKLTFFATARPKIRGGSNDAYFRGVKKVANLIFIYYLISVTVHGVKQINKVNLIRR